VTCFSDYKKKTELDVKDKFPLNFSSEVQLHVSGEKTTGVVIVIIIIIIIIITFLRCFSDHKKNRI